jgi:hypothetical protein
MQRLPRVISLCGALSLLLVAATVGACTVFTDASELEADPNTEADGDTSGDSDQSATCTLNLDLKCPVGTEKRPFEERASYGVCDEGDGSRYLRDLDGLKGFCNGVEGCGYVCVQEDAPPICDGQVNCPPGFYTVDRGALPTELARIAESTGVTISNTACGEEGVITDDIGRVIATCQARSGCEFACIQEFAINCQCGANAQGGCLPCARDCSDNPIYCLDGSCIAVATLSERACATDPDCPDNIDDIVTCVWYTTTPPLTCTPEGLNAFKPLQSVIIGCLLFECGDPNEKVPLTQVCDGFDNCTDGFDESPAVCNLPCDPEDPESLQLHRGLFCDGAFDCPNGADEGEAICNYPCGDGQTVTFKELCNGQVDCANTADESPELCLSEVAP